MSAELSADDRAAVDRLVRSLEASWNDMDGVGFATPFAEDAAFVNVFGEITRGRAEIAERHVSLFRDYFPHSVIRLDLQGARLLGPGVALVHMQTEMHAPAGPLTGHYRSFVTMVLTKGDAQPWRIVAFQNTRQPANGSLPDPDQSRRAGEQAKDLDR